jgi:amidohydrolase
MNVIAASAQELQPRLVAWRRHLHQNPEISFREERTGAWLRDRVRELGLEPHAVAEGMHGFYADIEAPSPSADLVALRADIDALPVQEKTGVPWASQVPGVAHLCGHDMHSTMLLGAAELLLKHRALLKRRVRLCFQHAEEVPPGGAIDFVRSGAIEAAHRCFALHVRPTLAVGTFATRSGPVYAGSNSFRIHVKGRGGHAARPQETADPVLAASAIVVALQSVVARRVSPLDTVVLSVCMIRGGETYNVIPDEAEMRGGVRAYSMDRLHEVMALMQEIAGHVAAAHGCSATVHGEEPNPPVINNDAAAKELSAAARAVLGDAAVSEIEPSMGAEDFAYFSLARPSAIGLIGVAPQGGACKPLHNPEFNPDEGALWRGAAILAQAAIDA